MENLLINVNGIEKFAGGLTKDTTVDDLKFVMLSATDLKFTPDMLDEYGIFEKWQDSERLLDGKIKMYKLIRSFKSFPGDQLTQVKFMIKKRIPFNKKSAPTQAKPESKTGFKFCSLSPSVQKTWNEEKINRKTSFVKKQLATLIKTRNLDETITSIASSAWSSGCDELVSSEQLNRYASIKNFNRVRESSIRKISKCGNVKKLHLEDDVTCLKAKLLQSLEYELKQIEQQDEICFLKRSLSCTSSTSSLRSTDSGISSACSDDDALYCQTQFETLV